MSSQSCDIGIFSELNEKFKAPAIKGFRCFSHISKKPFRSLAIYVRSELSNMVLRIPDKDTDIQTVHLLLKFTNLPTSLIVAYLDVESSCTADTFEKKWHKVTAKVEASLQRGEGVIMMADMNRPLQCKRKSKGTYLLLEWVKLDKMSLLNNHSTSNRYNPGTNKGSTLDLCLVSKSIANAVKSFEVDSLRNWSPFAVQKRPD